jgi:hypothetical protein
MVWIRRHCPEAGGRTKKCTRVADRAFPEVRVTWRQPGDFGRSSLSGNPIDTRLRKLIDDYVAAVRTAVTAMTEMGIPLPSSNDDWAYYQLPDGLILPPGTRMQKHGYGCRFKNDDVYVDFDFGANGEIDGFDCWRLYDFCRGHLRSKYGFASETELNESFDCACNASELVFSGYILWYNRTSA